jgi:hypothetical protein
MLLFADVRLCKSFGLLCATLGDQRCPNHQHATAARRKSVRGYVKGIPL